MPVEPPWHRISLSLPGDATDCHPQQSSSRESRQSSLPPYLSALLFPKCLPLRRDVAARKRQQNASFSRCVFSKLFGLVNSDGRSGKSSCSSVAAFVNRRHSQRKGVPTPLAKLPNCVSTASGANAHVSNSHPACRAVPLVAFDIETVGDLMRL
ncbi:hypothetical protein BKA81DRAFT_381204 [Phyllosticta paracitricarpa]